MMQKRLKTNRAGFTLLEMIVSMGIFSFVAVIAVGSLVRITGLNRQAQSLQSAMNNVSFALESISREMRFGTNYYCALNKDGFTSGELDNLAFNQCEVQSTSETYVIAFKSSKLGTGPVNTTCQLVYAYWFANNTIRKDQQVTCDDPIRMADASEIIDSTNVRITSYGLSVTKPTNTSQTNKFSWAAIRLDGYSGTRENEKTVFSIRTGISERIAD